jgi:hypothetical protein
VFGRDRLVIELTSPFRAHHDLPALERNLAFDVAFIGQQREPGTLEVDDHRSDAARLRIDRRPGSSTALSGSPHAAQKESSSLIRVPQPPQNVGALGESVFEPQCGQKWWARSIERAMGQGALRSDLLPEASTTAPDARQAPRLRSDGRGTPSAARTGIAAVEESDGRIRQPQWAQKL